GCRACADPARHRPRHDRDPRGGRSPQLARHDRRRAVRRRGAGVRRVPGRRGVSLASLTGRLFDAVRADCPAAWTLLRERGAGLWIAGRIGRERFAVRVGGDGPRVLSRAPGDAPVAVTTELAVLRALLTGAVDVTTALTGDTLEVRAAPAELARLDEFVR